MSELIVTTDKKWKLFKYRYEVPARVLAREFDYQDESVSDGYFRYKGSWYHLDQFEQLPRSKNDKSGLSGWDGHHGDSYFSGTLIKVSPDGEMYQVGWYYQKG